MIFFHVKLYFGIGKKGESRTFSHLGYDYFFSCVTELFSSFSPGEEKTVTNLLGRRNSKNMGQALSHTYLQVKQGT